MHKNNYIMIMGFMVDDLKLKGSDLLVYALIYGFSQDGESKYYGSRKYIADWFNCSLPTIDKALNNLLDKKLIIKEEEIINGVKFNRYRVDKKSLAVSKNLSLDEQESFSLYEQETLYNNNNINNININIDRERTIEEIFGE